MSWSIIYNYYSLSRIQNTGACNCETQNFANELIVVHVSVHLTMVKSLYLGHVCARRKGGGGEQRYSRQGKEIEYDDVPVSVKNQMFVLTFLDKVASSFKPLVFTFTLKDTCMLTLNYNA